MTAQELIDDLCSRGIQLRLSPDGRRIEGRGPLTDEDRARVRRERLWLLMLLAHRAGGDLYDPRLAFLGDAERGLTRDAIATRMEIAFDINRELSHSLIELAHKAGYLCLRGELYQPVGDFAALLLTQTVLPASALARPFPDPGR